MSWISEVFNGIFSWQLARKRLVLIGTPTSVSFLRPDGSREEEVVAQVHTGSSYSVLDEKLARDLGFYASDLVVESVEVPELGKRKFPVVFVSFVLGGREKRSRWVVADRSEARFPVMIGRNDLAGFLVQINENV